MFQAVKEWLHDSVESRHVNVTVLALIGGTGALGIWLLKSYRRQRNLPPSVPGLPIIGSIPFMGLTGTDDHLRYQELAEKYGNVYGFWLSNRYVIVLSGYETIRTSLLDQSVIMAGRSTADGFIAQFTNPPKLGIVEANYSSRWKEDQKVSLAILREFGFGRNTMERRIQEHVENLISYIRDLRGNSSDLGEAITISVSSVITAIILGKQFTINNCNELKEEVLNPLNLLVPLVGEAMMIDLFPILVHLPSLSRNKAKYVGYFTRIREYMRSVIIEHEAMHHMGKEDDFIDAYIGRMGEDYKRENLVFIVRDLIMAGSGTTATTLLWMVLYMGNNPHIQKRVQEELDRVAGRDRSVYLDDKSQLPYTEAVVQESQRLASLVPSGFPRMTLDNTELCGYHIPQDSIVWINLWSVLRDPKLWPEPNVFRPERFLDENGQAIHRPELIPFSLGRRGCLGEVLARQELFLFFCGLMQNFNIRLPDGVDKLDEDGKTFNLRCPLPFQIIAEPRF